MRIGQASRVSGASVRALRHYEDEGLITPGRHGNGYRDYCDFTIARVRRVRSLLDVGLPLRLVREVLPHLEDEATPISSVCDEFLDEVQRYRDNVAARIADLAAQQDSLDTYLRDARGRQGPDRG
ncbi:MerR family transcriptional regulator [Nocardiopsis sp. NRRL B-16309]|uniref:MerR family transcriptional regulator n=1 Tax=Nocardiopsis sp. NRRL B-16309 TaxID=1519494 RepID=UPI0006AFCE22|nr:MerR family transcriptional regulator [Nocardiopsis sp. NRRL B-16309]KOX10481.1 MerR family transcriptional regulator [Nocardiopsis sp. NRRL B-16309]